MGLGIKRYCYSYGRLHKLRQLALYYEGIGIDIFAFYKSNIPTKFNEFINHSDADGVYISKNSPRYEEYKKSYTGCYFGDLDKLKEELKELDPYMQNHANDNLDAWNAFYADVIEENEIVEFR